MEVEDYKKRFNILFVYSTVYIFINTLFFQRVFPKYSNISNMNTKETGSEIQGI